MRKADRKLRQRIIQRKQKVTQLPIGGCVKYEVDAFYARHPDYVTISRQSAHRYVVSGDVPSNAIRIWSTFEQAFACFLACIDGKKWKIA
ncbi:hypothetical protein EVB87_035 [Rhizobium phage RHph_N28_1]|nr:hypothetical protein EVB87_035 [Rhizobium phage RHph_N28_1]QIG74063.1 hypothetical protein EVC07_035 [Rhizobium phage RHph_N42]